MPSNKSDKVTISPLPDKKSVQSIRLDFFCASQSSPIQIELPSKLARAAAKAILEVLGPDNNPPQSIRGRAAGKPKLKIVR